MDYVLCRVCLGLTYKKYVRHFSGYFPFITSRKSYTKKMVHFDRILVPPNCCFFFCIHNHHQNDEEEANENTRRNDETWWFDPKIIEVTFFDRTGDGVLPKHVRKSHAILSHFMIMCDVIEYIQLVYSFNHYFLDGARFYSNPQFYFVSFRFFECLCSSFIFLPKTNLSLSHPRN